MISVRFKFSLLALSTCTLVACGSSSGGKNGSSSVSPRATQQPSTDSQNKQEASGSDSSADAVEAGVAELPEELSDINTDEVAGCHSDGHIFDRRTAQCSPTMYLATSYACDRAGVKSAFKLTGFQIDEALKAAAEDGFVLDQCGESESGLLIAYFVRRDEDGSLMIREIETKL